jgi:hypothetical protein
MRYKLEDLSYKLRDTRYKLQAKKQDIKLRLCWLMIVQYGTWAVVRLYSADPYHTLLEFICPGWLSEACTSWLLSSPSTVPYNHQPAQEWFLSWQNGAHCLQDFVNLTGSSSQLLLRCWNRFYAPLFTGSLYKKKPLAVIQLISIYHLSLAVTFVKSRWTIPLTLIRAAI